VTRGSPEGARDIAWHALMASGEGLCSWEKTGLVPVYLCRDGHLSMESCRK
jgi:hypothetical protein